MKERQRAQFITQTLEQAELKGKEAELKGKEAELKGKEAELKGKEAELKGKVIIAGLLMGMTLGIVFNPIRINATSLDNVVYEQQETVDDSGAVREPALVEENNSTEENNDFIKELRGATNLSEPTTTGKSINKFTSTIASFIVQILSYFITAFLVVRVVGDICYITLPFTRDILANGKQGQSQVQNQAMNPMGQGQMGMSAMGQNPMQAQGQMGMGAMAQNNTGGVQYISNAALNAVATEQSGGGKAIKIYAKDMILVLLFTGILLVLAISGALTNLGIAIGNVISGALFNLGSQL